MKVPLLDLKAQLAAYRGDALAAMTRVMDDQRFILGPEVEALEHEIASFSGVAHGIGVSSGSDALLVSLMAHDIGPGDEVVTSPFTFFATAGAIVRVGARPVFADIDLDTFNLRDDTVERAIGYDTRAVIPVHLFGQVARLELYDLAPKQRPVIIEDAAQSLGAALGSKRAGGFGDMACFSFFPSKNLGGFGDGGMVVCDDEDLARKVRILRVHGSSPKYYHPYVGGNFRLDALQAAVLRVKFEHLEGWARARRRNAARYDELFQDAGLVERGLVKTPVVLDRDGHVFNQYTIRVDRRDELKEHLGREGIGTAVYYPVPLHLQPCFEGLGYGPGDFPNAERASREVLSIPVYPELTEDAQAYVVRAIAKFFGVEA